MTVLDLVDGLITILKDLKDEEEKPYFDKIWQAEPDFKNQKFNNTAIIEVQSQPNFYYTTCRSNTMSDVDIILSIFTRGTLEGAKRQLYTLTSIVQDALNTNPKIEDTCLDSTLEETFYGEYAIPNLNTMVSASQIRLRCKL